MVPWEEYRYVSYARRFGWTPEQVDSLPLGVEGWMWPIVEAIDDAEAKAQEKAQEAAARRHKKFGRRR